jgi:hypothetical protein
MCNFDKENKKTKQLLQPISSCIDNDPTKHGTFTLECFLVIQDKIMGTYRIEKTPLRILTRQIVILLEWIFRPERPYYLYDPQGVFYEWQTSTWVRTKKPFLDFHLDFGIEEKKDKEISNICVFIDAKRYKCMNAECAEVLTKQSCPSCHFENGPTKKPCPKLSDWKTNTTDVVPLLPSAGMGVREYARWKYQKFKDNFKGQGQGLNASVPSGTSETNGTSGTSPTSPTSQTSA